MDDPQLYGAFPATTHSIRFQFFGSVHKAEWTSIRETPTGLGSGGWIWRTAASVGRKAPCFSVRRSAGSKPERRWPLPLRQASAFRKCFATVNQANGRHYLVLW